MSDPPATATRHDQAPGRCVLQLSIVLDGRGGLIFVAVGECGLALRQALVLPPAGLRPWVGGAWRHAASPAAFGRELAQALLPAAVQQALLASDGGVLQLWLDTELAAVPWELAVVQGRLLDEQWLISRQLLSDGLALCAADEPVPQLAPDHPHRLLQLHHPHQPLSLLLLDGDENDAWAWQAAAAAGRAGRPAVVLPLQAEPARQALANALAQGLPAAQAAQLARGAARRSATAGGTAWLHGVAAWPGAVPPPMRAARPDDDVRQVSILSCDLVDSTGQMQRLGDEEYSERLSQYHQRVARISRAHAGLADDPQGDDGLMCYFGHPLASEDAVALALRAGLALSSAFGDLGLQVRIGVSTGRVVIRNGQPVGAAVHHAARLQSAAAPGGVLAGAATRRIAGERFAFSSLASPLLLKGFEDSGAVFRVLHERPALGTERFDDRADLTPFVGRDAELAQLLQCWHGAVDGQRQTLLLHGEAGIGKSRLLREFRQVLAAQGFRTLECRCAAEHSASAFQPLIDLLRRRLQLQPGDPPAVQLARLRALQVTTAADGGQALALLGALLSVPESVLPPLADKGSPDRRRRMTLDLLSRVAITLADEAPVCLILEDVQWIDPSTRELLQRLIKGAPEQRLMLLLTLRGGADEMARCAFESPQLAGLRLGGLADEAARALLRSASGGALHDGELAQWLTARADGVPLFIEETARMAAALALQRPQHAIAAGLREVVPGTLRDLLMARLDQLPTAKRAAQLAGALGREFPGALIEAVSAHADSPIRLPALGQQLGALLQAGLLTSRREGDGLVYSFRHALLRDAAHQSLLERDRRRLHAAIAQVLQRDFAPWCQQQPEALAQHQEQAGLLAEALAGWEQAARRAARRSALHEAIAHLRRALGLLAGAADLPDRQAAELRLLLLLSGLLIATAGYGAPQALVVYQRALALAQALGDEAALAKLRAGLEGYHFMRGDFARAQAMADDMLAALGRRPDPLARLQAGWAQAKLLFHQGDLPQAVAATDRCLADYRQGGLHANAVQDPGVLCLSYAAWALWQMGQADRALGRALEAVALAERLQHPFATGQALGFLAVLHLFRGESLPGLRAAERAIEVCEAGGFVQWLAHARVLHGRLRLAMGEPDSGLDELAAGLAQWTASGAVVTRPFYLALQAEGLLLTGRADEALPLLAEAQALIARHGERFYEPELHRLTGELLLARGDDQGARPWLQRACALAHDLQQPGLALRAAMSLARLLLAQGRPDEAAPQLAAALAAINEGHDTQDPRQAAALLASCQQLSSSVAQ